MFSNSLALNDLKRDLLDLKTKVDEIQVTINRWKEKEEIEESLKKWEDRLSEMKMTLDSKNTTATGYSMLSSYSYTHYTITIKKQNRCVAKVHGDWRHVKTQMNTLINSFINCDKKDENN